jgi:hypothetical protein
MGPIEHAFVRLVHHVALHIFQKISEHDLPFTRRPGRPLGDVPLRPGLGHLAPQPVEGPRHDGLAGALDEAQGPVDVVQR